MLFWLRHSHDPGTRFDGLQILWVSIDKLGNVTGQKSFRRSTTQWRRRRSLNEISGLAGRELGPSAFSHARQAPKM